LRFAWSFDKEEPRRDKNGAFVMDEQTKRPSPPYASFASFLSFINKLRDTRVPSRIDPSVFGNASGSLSYSIIAALKSLKLIGADGVPTKEFQDFVKASDEERKPLMQEILKVGFPTLWNGSIDLTSASAGQFDEHIRSQYDAKGSTVDKVATFFISAAKFAGAPISPHLAARKPTASSAASGKSKRQRKGENGDLNGENQPQLPPATNAPISDKALEYKLVDLMKDDDIGDDQRTAIWTLIQYLTAKSKKKAAEPS
jgi:hypothetical protein